MSGKKINTILDAPGNTKKFFSIKKKIITPIIVIILIAGSAAGYFTYQQTKASFATRERYLIDQVTHSKADQIKTLLEEKLTLVETAAKNTELMDQIINAQKDSDLLTKRLEEYNYENDYLAIYVIDTEGTTLVSTDLNFVGKNYSFREYFKEAINGNVTVHTAIGITSNQLGYYFSAPIIYGDEIKGVVVFKLDPKIINNGLNEEKTHKENNDQKVNVDFILSDSNGVILHSKDGNKIFKFLGRVSSKTATKLIENRTYENIDMGNLNYTNIQDAIEKGENHSQFDGFDEFDSRQEIAVAVRTGELPFYLISEADLTEVTRFAAKNAVILGLAVMGAAISTLLILVYITDKTLKPLEGLANTIRKNRKGEILDPEKFTIDTGDEIEDIGQAIKELAEDLLMEKRMVESKIEKQTKQLNEQKKALMNVLEDVQVEKDIANAAASELEKFKLATDNVSEHIVITDPEGFIIYANKAVEKITGFQIVDVLGKKAGGKELWGGNMPRSFYVDMWYTIKEKKQSFSGEIKNRRKNGEEYFAYATITPVLNEYNEVIFFVGIERDVTKEKEVDRMKTEFISLASHQLRTPLSAMKWFLEMLINEEAGKLTKTQKEFLGNIDQSNERMIDLVNSLLNVSRIESGRIIVDPMPTDIKEHVEQILKELDEKIKDKKLKFKFNIEEGLPKIRVDPKLVKHVYQNLLSNAIKYTPEKGQITLDIRQNGPELTSKISDTGFGITEKDKEKVFNKFFRGENIVNKDTDGNGLGLYMVKAIVDSSKGSIWFESEEDKGTTFWFTLPMEGMEPKEGVVTIQE